VTRRWWTWVVLALAAAVLGAAVLTHGMGFTSRATPWAIEAWTMRAARSWATPAQVRREANPVAVSPDVLQAGMEHWADHCALCHDNDGSGRTARIKGFYPPVPDMRTGPTQAMTDGELFYVIEHGIPLSGMPAWGNGTADGERQTWHLVRFIRHLPALTGAEIARMETLNPKSAAEIEQERQIQDFLKGQGGGSHLPESKEE
jgi:mono/diheme cytochrome c family protein